MMRTKFSPSRVSWHNAKKLFYVSLQCRNQLIGTAAPGHRRMPRVVEQVLENVSLDHLGHQAVGRTTRGDDDVQDFRAVVFFSQCAFDRVDPTAQAGPCDRGKAPREYVSALCESRGSFVQLAFRCAQGTTRKIEFVKNEARISIPGSCCIGLYARRLFQDRRPQIEPG